MKSDRTSQHHRSKNPMTTKHAHCTQMKPLHPALLAALQQQRSTPLLVAAAVHFGIINSHHDRLSDRQRNQTLDAIDQAHPGWRFYGAAVSQFHDVYDLKEAA